MGAPALLTVPAMDTLRPEKRSPGASVPPPVLENKGALKAFLLQSRCLMKMRCCLVLVPPVSECTLQGQAGSLSTAAALELWESRDGPAWL